MKLVLKEVEELIEIKMPMTITIHTNGKGDAVIEANLKGNTLSEILKRMKIKQNEKKEYCIKQ